MNKYVLKAETQFLILYIFLTFFSCKNIYFESNYSIK